MIIGGGLAGLTAAIDLAQSDIDVQVIEKKSYPFHRVCGEYISNETVSYLRKLGAYPEKLSPSKINRFMLSSPGGNSIEGTLDLGGFGISRFHFDRFLKEKAAASGAIISDNTAVTHLTFNQDRFQITTTKGEISAPVVIGAFGKRSTLDRQLEWLAEHSGGHPAIVAVDVHYRTDDTARAALFAGLSKGQAFINGENLGRYFTATATGKAVGPQTRQEFAGLAGDAVAKAAFAAEEGAIVGPVQSDLGWHVVTLWACAVKTRAAREWLESRLPVLFFGRPMPVAPGLNIPLRCNCWMACMRPVSPCPAMSFMSGAIISYCLTS